jgi:sugar/nucleoside kinase (ribokinase family)
MQYQDLQLLLNQFGYLLSFIWQLFYIQVSIEELNHILTEVNAILPSCNDLSQRTTIAGGSVANTIRGLSAGFGISTGIIGACGDDNQGILFANNMGFSGVDLTRLRAKKGHTAQVV